MEYTPIGCERCLDKFSWKNKSGHEKLKGLLDLIGNQNHSMYKSQTDRIGFDSQSLFTLMILNMGYMPRELFEQFRNWSEDQIEQNDDEEDYKSDRKFGTKIQREESSSSSDSPYDE